MQNLKHIYISTLGCAKNQVDAEVLITYLKNDGWIHCDTPEQADIIFVNTCGFISSAKEESLNEVLALKHAFPGKKVVMGGCLAERYGHKFSSTLQEIDAFVGNGNLSRIPEFLDAVLQDSSRECFPCYASDLKTVDDIQRTVSFGFPRSRYVKIAEGCSNRCSYCAIPLIRGDLRSREIESVVREITLLLESGVFEINLVAQDLGAYGMDRGKPQLLELLKRLSALDGKFWVRCLYIHPDKFPRELLSLCREDSRILPYFDIPFQHGSTSILRKMGRREDSGYYLDLIREIRAELPDAAVRSTFLLGFPGETKDDFANLVSFIEQARLDWAGFFTYSPEEGTPAYRLTGPVREALKKRLNKKRLEQLQYLQGEITQDRLKRFVFREFDVLLEEKIQGESMTLGRTYFQAPEVDGTVVVLGDKGNPGDLLRCKIIRQNIIDLEAEVLGG